MEPVILRTTPDQFIQPRKTAAYTPTVMGGDWYARAVDDKPWFTWRDVERMRRDPQIQFGLRILRAPLYRVQWTVEADTTRIAKLVDSTLHDIWDGYLQPMLTTQFTWGIVPGELSHRMSRGQVIVDRFDPVHPMDARPLEINARSGGRQFVGLRIKGSNQNPLDTAGTTNCDILTPHAWWHSGEAEFGSYYSRPRIADAFVSWSEKSAKGGAIESRRLWFKKCAFRGGTMRHPVGATEYIAANGETVVINNEDLARQIIERYENGGVLTLPNTTDSNGNYLWIYEPPGTNGEASGIRDYPKDLDDEILKGLGIPPEIITAAETGSGWSGRAIPAMMFFSSEDEVAKGLIRTAEVQACRPLVGLNYGHKFTRRFKIKVKSLADILGEDPQAAKGILNEPDGRQQAGGLSGFNGGGGGQSGGGVGGGVGGGSGGGLGGGGKPVQLSHEALEVLDRRLEKDIAAIQLGFDEFKVHRADDGKFSSPTKQSPTTDPIETPESTSPLKSFVGIKLNGEAGKQFRKMAQMVSDQDLAEDGREDDPHVTVKYGLLTQTPDEVEKLLSNFGKVTIRISRLSIFPATEGKNHEVLKAEVEGESLRKLNELLGSLPHIDSYAEYKPHATIAYLKPGLGEEYIRRLDWHGAYYTAHEVEFSNDARQKTIIPLVNPNSDHGIA